MKPTKSPALKQTLPSTRTGLLGGEWASIQTELDKTSMREAYQRGFMSGLQYGFREGAEFGRNYQAKNSSKPPSERKRAVAVATNKLRSEWHFTALFKAARLLADNPQYPPKKLHFDLAEYINAFEHPSLGGRQIPPGAVKKMLERRRESLESLIAHFSKR